MENKISIQKLATLMALASGKELKLCEDFLQEFFRLIGDQISSGDNVRIKRFGTFKLTEVEARRSVNVATGESFEIAAHRKVVFVPAKELADAVNSPFEMFEAIEIGDTVTTAELVEADGRYDFGSTVENEPTDDPASIIKTEVSPSVTLQSQVIEEVDMTVAETEEPKLEADSEERDFVEREEQSLPQLSGIDFESHEDIDHRSPKFLWGFIAGVALCAGVGVGLWYFKLLPTNGQPSLWSERESVATTSLDKNSVDDSISFVSVTPATGEEVATQPSDKPVYDTVTQTRYLTTMAREHYNNYNLWPIIYEENKSFLGHPDRITPGTRVVIPSLTKYGVDVNNTEDVKRIKTMGVEIYRRYKSVD